LIFKGLTRAGIQSIIGIAPQSTRGGHHRHHQPAITAITSPPSPPSPARHHRHHQPAITAITSPPSPPSPARHHRHHQPAITATRPRRRSATTSSHRPINPAASVKQGQGAGEAVTDRVLGHVDQHSVGVHNVEVPDAATVRE
jgi:hypothetical protein